MAEFFQLPPAERLEALNVAADQSGVPPHLLEKDVWVVWSLQHLFGGPHAQPHRSCALSEPSGKKPRPSMFFVRRVRFEAVSALRATGTT